MFSNEHNYFVFKQLYVTYENILNDYDATDLYEPKTPVTKGLVSFTLVKNRMSSILLNYKLLLNKIEKTLTVFSNLFKRFMNTT